MYSKRDPVKLSEELFKVIRNMADIESTETSLRLSKQPLSLRKCASRSFAKYAVDTLMEILLTTHLKGNMNAAEESCKKLKHYVHELPLCLGEELFQLIFNHITQIRMEIEAFNRQPWFSNVMELFAEAVIHPKTSTVCYTGSTSLSILQYLIGHLHKRRTFKKFMFYQKNITYCYRWETTNQTHQDVFLELNNEKNKRENQEQKVVLITFNGMFINVFKRNTSVMYTLEDFLTPLDTLEVFIYPEECTDYLLLSQSSRGTLKIVDVSLSPRVTNNAITFLGSIPNIVGLNILHTGIDQSGTVTLLENLLKTSKHCLKYFLSTRMFTPEALNLLHEFPLMNDVESSLRFFRSLHDVPMPFYVYNMIKDCGRLRGEKMLGYAAMSNV